MLIPCHLPHPQHQKLASLEEWCSCWEGGWGRRSSASLNHGSSCTVRVMRCGVWGECQEMETDSRGNHPLHPGKSRKTLPWPYSPMEVSTEFKSWPCLGPQTPWLWLASLFSSEKWPRRVITTSSDLGTLREMEMVNWALKCVPCEYFYLIVKPRSQRLAADGRTALGQKASIPSWKIYIQKAISQLSPAWWMSFWKWE